jgi:Mn-dependent DtxR family transcriptional regulator
VKGSQSSHPTLAAQEAEETILNLLRDRPMRMAEVMKEMQAKQSTTSERLRRLRQRGLVVVDGGAWTAASL